MKERIGKGWLPHGNGGRRSEEAESCIIDIENLSSEGKFEVTWSDGATWGDMGIDFTIQDRKITD